MASTATAPAENAVRRYPLRVQLMVAAGGTLTVALLTFLSTKIYAQQFGAEQVSAVLIFRICASFLMGMASLGMPIAIQRTVALRHQDDRSSASLAVAGVITGSASLGIVCAISTLFAPWLANATHHAEAATLWNAFAALTWIQGTATMLALVDLGRGRVFASTATTVWAYGVALIVPPVLLPGTPLPILIKTTAAIAALACAFCLARLVHWAIRARITALAESLRQLLRYGIPRITANLLEPSSDLVLPWIAVFSGGLRAAGDFAAGLALLRPLNPIVSSLNLVLIPDEARLSALGAHEQQRRRASLLTQTALHLGAFSAMSLAVWCDALLEFWLGPQFASAAPAARVLSLALLPTMIYGTTRGIIDGQAEKAVNSLNLVLSFCVLLAGAGLGWLAGGGVLLLATSYVLSRITLAALSMRHLFRSHNLNLADLKYWQLFVSITAATAMLLAVRGWLHEHAMFAFAVGITTSAAMFFVLEAKFDVQWTRVLHRRS
jgi:O-antigen/teichoic acid export membrane protein